MRPKHPCFISFRHVGGSEKFVRVFHECLQEELENYFGAFDANKQEGVFLDETRMIGSPYLENVMARELCSSVCLVVIYVPTYFNRDWPWCATEYRAMQLLEQERRNMDPSLADLDSLIIPAAFRNADEFRSRKLVSQVFDFQHVSLSANMKTNRKFKEMVVEISNQIYDRHQRFSQVNLFPWNNCQNPLLPKQEDALQALNIPPFNEAYILK